LSLNTLVLRANYQLAGEALQEWANCADNALVAEERPAVAPGVVRAALALSAVPSQQAVAIARKLRAGDRIRLRMGQEFVRDASIDDRRRALAMLVHDTKRGPKWCTPPSHDPKDCPFRRAELLPRMFVARVLDDIAARQPLHAAVALCHLDAKARDEIWSRMSSDARGDVVVHLPEVPRVSVGRTHCFARELNDKLDRD
jgi:hypothetical protein